MIDVKILSVVMLTEMQCCHVPAPSLRRTLLACAILSPLLSAGALQATEPPACMVDLAKTRNGSLGLPNHAEVTPDGHSVLFLRSGPFDTHLHLYRYDLPDHSLHELAAPPRVRSICRSRKRPGVNGRARSCRASPTIR